MRENDAPFSSQWEEYSLDDLNGQSFKTTLAGWDEVFAAMEPVCPKCGSNLKPGDLVNP
ncbi:hypothetical protein MKK65_26510 [Methylobacterium sp. J-001]|jgi:hypothetical protein|uniref:hypothetical protein n=1 Tax=Methylobacterium sp. J-001 TaxID=2836609 RepID=UPI001FB9ED64|nr:hypothetical protein [Methylobacterium sp. J-001]MCJ2120083.1 hypothetical protein [Methylobacterium sp. J-001]